MANLHMNDGVEDTRPTLPSIKTSNDENISNLYKLGYTNIVIANCWKKYFNKKEKGKCQVCNHKLQIPKQVVNFYKLPYRKNKSYPPAHFIFNEAIEDNTPELWESIKQYLSTKSNQDKMNLLIPICYECYNQSTNYSAHSLISKSEEINFNKLDNETLNEQQIQAKLEYNYSYQFNWYKHYGYCIYTKNAVKFCGCRSNLDSITCSKHIDYQVP